MAKKELGHIELNWDCPNCGGGNLGRDQTCSNCGAPQPEDVAFYQPAQQEILTEEGLIARAAAGPDIHCPYCGTRNPGNAAACMQCGGDLSEGARRKAGQVLGAYGSTQAGEVACPNCGTMNPAAARTCSSCGASLAVEKPAARQAAPPADEKRRATPPIALIIGAAVILLACVALFILLTRTNQVTGVVQSGNWERAIPIEALVPVEREAWLDEVPSESDLLGCSEEVRSVQDQPTFSSVEVCGTPYSVDSGSGFAEVVQDCEYQVYDQYCQYTVDEWTQVDQATLTGEGYSASWPSPQLAEGQRLGEGRGESYTIVFVADGETYTFTTDDFSLFQLAVPGTEWNLDINTFGGVASIE